MSTTAHVRKRRLTLLFPNMDLEHMFRCRIPESGATCDRRLLIKLHYLWCTSLPEVMLLPPGQHPWNTAYMYVTCTCSLQRTASYRHPKYDLVRFDLLAFVFSYRLRGAPQIFPYTPVLIYLIAKAPFAGPKLKRICAHY
jgi:hypothetical protein